MQKRCIISEYKRIIRIEKMNTYKQLQTTGKLVTFTGNTVEKQRIIITIREFYDFSQISVGSADVSNC